MAYSFGSEAITTYIMCQWSLSLKPKAPTQKLRECSSIVEQQPLQAEYENSPARVFARKLLGAKTNVAQWLDLRAYCHGMARIFLRFHPCAGCRRQRTDASKRSAAIKSATLDRLQHSCACSVQGGAVRSRLHVLMPVGDNANDRNLL